MKDKLNPTTIRMTEAEKKEADAYLQKHTWLKGFSALIRYALQQLFAKDKGPTK